MAKYGKSVRQERGRNRPWDVHPIWRGIGCLMLVIIPVVSYAGAVLLVNANIERHWFPTSSSIMQTVSLPLLGQAIPHLYANLLVAIVLTLLGFALLMIVYALLYSILGPSKYSPIDAPPVRK